MRFIRIAGLCLVALAAMAMATAATASAAPVWEQNGTEVKGTEKVMGTGTLKLKDTKTLLGTSEVECGGAEKGTIGPGSLDRVEVIEVQASQCAAKKVCENVEEITAKGLPWQTEVYESGKELRDNIKTTGNGEPGWRVKCKTIGGSKVDECLAEAGLVPSTKVTNETVKGVVVSEFEEEHSPKAKCTEGGAKSGAVVGLITLLSATAGSRIRVS